MMEQGNQEKHLNLLLENSPDIVLFLDKAGRILYCSRIFLTITGIGDFEKIRNRNFFEVYRQFRDPQFIRHFRKHFSQVKSGFKTVTENVSIDFSRRGEPRRYTIDSTPIHNESGKFEGALVIYHDVTDIFRAEEDERILAMFDALPLACTFWDAEGNVVDCNQEALNLFKVPDKKEFCRRFSDFSPAFQADGSFSRDKIKENFWKTNTGGDIKFPWLHRSATGDRIPCFVNLVRIKYRDDYRVVGYTRDLRDIQELEDKRRKADERNRELEVQNRAARVASEEKSKFLASMSHEIRTPMNAIIGMSDLIRTDNLDDTQKSFFEDIRKMSKTLLQIINDILDISKIEAGKMDLSPVHFNFTELYDNLCSLNRFSAEAKDLEFRHHLDPQVPQVIYGDDVRIRQILTNVLNNAVKYTREGYVEFAAGRSRRGEKDYLVFSVTDTGIGIRKKDFSRLFGNFQQLDSSTNRGIMGTGLGLAITKNLVTLMGGEILFDSEYGKGSVFTVLLPLIEGDPAQVERRTLKSRVVAADNARVLVVDDNQVNLKVAVAFLAVHNIKAETALNGLEAVEKVKAQPYDIVFMDHMMPGMDGIEACRRIRDLAKSGGAGEKRFQTMPIIALSANAVSGARKLFFAAGMNDFIPKPIEAADLNMKLARWLPADRIARFEESLGAGSRGSAPAAEGSIHAADEHGGRDPEPEAGVKPGGAPEERGGSGNDEEVLNRIGGLNNAGNDRDLYRRICAAFYHDHGDDAARIRNALAEGDIKLAHRLAHTLKSTAGLIGAEKLFHTAFAMEKALAAEKPSLHTEMDRLESELGELLARLEKDCLAVFSETEGQDDGGAGMAGAETASPGEGHDGDSPGNSADIRDVIAFCDRLEPLLKAGSTESLAFLDEIKKTPSLVDGEGKNPVKQLIKQIEDFEFPAALQTLRDLRRKTEDRGSKEV
jgi:PAS domain S-box-containing protein